MTTTGAKEYMIKLLMIQPENAEINRFRRLQLNNFSQLTIPYLAAYVDERDYEITLIDEYNQKVPYEAAFDLVAITVNTPNAPHCYRMSERFREKGVKVVMGGSHATLVPQEVREHCDYLLVGESEDIWPQFLREFKEGNPQQMYQCATAPDLANLPLPRWDLLKRNPLMKGAIIATRGCPYNCRYCNLKQIYKPQYRKRPVDEVVREIQALKGRYFVFWDDNLFADKEYVKTLLEKMIPLKRSWAAQATLRNCDDEELLSLAKAAGCMYLFVGLESFSEDALEDAGKAANRTSEYEPIITQIHRHGIMVQAGVIFGFDSDTLDVFDKALTACERLGIDGVTVSILTPFPETPIYQQLKDEGRLITMDWSSYNSKTTVAFIPRNMTPAQLMQGYNGFRRRFYSLGSFIRRMRVSRTRVAVNFILNLGYRLGIR